LKKNKLWVTIATSAAGLVLLLTLNEPTHAQHETTLTPGDYIEIQQLVNRFADGFAERVMQGHLER